MADTEQKTGDSIALAIGGESILGVEPVAEPEDAGNQNATDTKETEKTEDTKKDKGKDKVEMETVKPKKKEKEAKSPKNKLKKENSKGGKRKKEPPKKKKFKTPKGRERFYHKTVKAPKKIKDDYKPVEEPRLTFAASAPMSLSPNLMPTQQYTNVTTSQYSPNMMPAIGSQIPHAVSFMELEEQESVMLDTNASVSMGDMESGDEKEEEMWFYQQPKTKRILFFDGKLKRVSAINTADETFRAVFHYYLTWLATEDEVEGYFTAKNKRKLKEQIYIPDFSPRLQFNNFVDGNIDQASDLQLKEGFSFKNGMKKECKYGWDNKKTSWDISGDVIGFDPRKAFWFRIQFECDVTLAEELELDFFPFDCQDFGIHMRTPGKANKMDVLPLPRIGAFWSVDAKYSMVSEWHIPGVTIEFNIGDAEASKLGIPYPDLSIRIKAERKWHTHISTLVITFCMFFLGLGTFSIGKDDVGDRLGYGITLLLADVATLQLSFDTMPNIPYETFMDTYMYSCFIFLVGVTLWSCFAPLEHVASGDFYVFLSAIALFVLIHVVLGWRLHTFRSVERRKLRMTGDQLDKFFAEAGADSLSDVPFCNCNWDMDKLARKKTNIAVKDFPYSQYLDSTTSEDESSSSSDEKKDKDKKKDFKD